MWLVSFQGLNVPFLPFDINPSYEGLLTFWTYVIILQVMIPLSLYVTIELSKILQVFHIHNNIELFDHQTNKRTECRAMNITEELGQIQYVFSDKTGTLTENKMIFRRCTIIGTDYNHPASELEKEFSKPGDPALPLTPNQKLVEDLTQLTDRSLKFSTNSQRMQEFLLVLAICNTVVVSSQPHHDLMNASGVIEDTTPRIKLVKSNNEMSNGHSSHSIADRYTRLAESRSITPSPPPNSMTPLALKTQQHIPSLSPISSSAETTPTSESPTLKIKTIGNNVTPTKRAKSIITSKISSLSSMLNNRSNNKKLMTLTKQK